MQETFQSSFTVPPSTVFDMHSNLFPRMVYRPSLSTIASSVSGSSNAPHVHPIPRPMPHWQGQAQAGALPANLQQPSHFAAVRCKVISVDQKDKGFLLSVCSQVWLIGLIR